MACGNLGLSPRITGTHLATLAYICWQLAPFLGHISYRSHP